MNPFHVAFPVKDLPTTRRFFCEVLGCSTGRESDQWIDFNLYGHQVVAHLSPDECDLSAMNGVDGKAVPVRHFGVILEWDQWHALADRLKNEKIKFLIEPYIRFAGEPGEQATMFFYDPSGNALEFKAFKEPSQLFAK